MLGNRKAAEEFILKYIQEIMPDGVNTKLYAQKFSKMTDEEFDVFMKTLKQNEYRGLVVVAPNFSKTTVTVERNFEVAEKLGHNFFQHIHMPAKDGIPAYITPVPYLVIPLPYRRQAQLLDKKISIPEDNLTVDDLTGQPTGDSKGSKISYPELQVVAALGLDKSLEELMKYRGGDEKGFAAMNTVISRTGGVSLKGISAYASGVKSTQALNAYLNAMQLSSTL